MDPNLITAFLALHSAVKTYPRLTAAEIVGPWREQGGVADENTKIGCGWRRAVQQGLLAGPTAAAAKERGALRHRCSPFGTFRSSESDISVATTTTTFAHTTPGWIKAHMVFS